MVVDIPVVDGHFPREVRGHGRLIACRPDRDGRQALEHVTLGSQELPQGHDLPFQHRELGEGGGIGLGQDLVFHLIGQLVETVEDGKQGVDELVDDKVKEECQLSVRHVRVRRDPRSQPVERVGRLVMHADQVLAREVEMVFSNQEVLGLELRRKEHDKNVAGVFVELRPLVLVANVLQRQRMELKGLLEEDIVVVVRLFNVEPETALSLSKASFELGRDRLEGRSRRGDQVSGYLISAEAPASFSFFSTPSASSRLTPCLTGLGAWSTRSLASLSPSPVISRTTLMTPILASPAAVKTTWNSVCSASGAAAAAPPAAGAAATATGAAAVTPNSVSIALMAFITSTTVHSLRLDTKSSTLTFAMGFS